jgi:hypothetical protein
MACDCLRLWLLVACLLLVTFYSRHYSKAFQNVSREPSKLVQMTTKGSYLALRIVELFSYSYFKKFDETAWWNYYGKGTQVNGQRQRCIAYRVFMTHSVSQYTHRQEAQLIRHNQSVSTNHLVWIASSRITNYTTSLIVQQHHQYKTSAYFQNL